MHRPWFAASLTGALAVTFVVQAAFAAPPALQRAVPGTPEPAVLAVAADAFEVAVRALPVVSPGAGDGSTANVSLAACDDGSAGGTLVQRIDAYYGNRFASACAAARIQSVTFVHYGYGLQGRYSFRLHVVDAACGEIGVTPVLTTPGAPDAVTTAEVDLTSYGWCVSGDFHILLEPLTCADGEAGRDCFPAVVVDATADGIAASHCATVSVLAGTERQCYAARSTDGRYFDFGLRAVLECDAPGCTTGVESATWSGVKRLYRDPAPASRD